MNDRPENSTPQSPELIAAPKSSKTPWLIGGVAVLIVAMIGAYFATRGEDTPAAGNPDRVYKLGVVGASDPYWTTYADAAKAAGINLEIVDFTDYNQPNPALSAGDIDLNQFQHIIYLADYNVANNDDLAAVGATATYPLGLYSKKYQDVASIPDGSEVAVPTDPSNQARALAVLQSAGLIKLSDGGTPFSDLADVDTAASRVKVKALDAALTATSLDDLAAGIVNNDFVEDAGLTFADALAKDDPAQATAKPYINIFATRAEDANNPDILKLVQIFQSTKAVTDGLQEVSGGTAVLTTTPAAELQATLDEVEQQTRDQK